MQRRNLFSFAIWCSACSLKAMLSFTFMSRQKPLRQTRLGRWAAQSGDLNFHWLIYSSLYLLDVTPLPQERQNGLPSSSQSLGQLKNCNETTKCWLAICRFKWFFWSCTLRGQTFSKSYNIRTAFPNTKASSPRQTLYSIREGTEGDITLLL